MIHLKQVMFISNLKGISMASSTITVGDKVIALTSAPNASSQPREVGKEYIVEGIKHCLKCGDYSLNLKGSEETTATRYACSNSKTDSDGVKKLCNHIISTDGKMWTNHQHFCKANEALHVLDIAVVEENYALAIILRDYLKTKVS